VNEQFPFKESLLLILLVLVIILSFNYFIYTLNAQQSSKGLSVLWVKYGRSGKAYATCVIGSILYVVGFSESAGVIEARDIKYWGYNR
jgi:TRAP-type C4-dicarboxylate transport system permease small subunit